MTTSVHNPERIGVLILIVDCNHDAIVAAEVELRENWGADSIGYEQWPMRFPDRQGVWCLVDAEEINRVLLTQQEPPPNLPKWPYGG